jgi:predicted nuclease of predicted toxin-antitoxin system
VREAVADGLRRRGVDLTTAKEVGLLTAADSAHLDCARRECRVVVTHDSDFPVCASTQSAHCGIAYCHIDSRSTAEIIAGILLIRDSLDPAEMHNHVEYL